MNVENLAPNRPECHRPFVLTRGKMPNDGTRIEAGESIQPPQARVKVERLKPPDGSQRTLKVAEDPITNEGGQAR